MKKKVLAANLSLWVLILFFDTEVFAQSDLPKSVQADLLQERIVAAARAQDYERMLSAISEYKALGIEIPTPLLFTEAQAASSLGQSERALAALEQYLKVAKREDQQYSDAIALYGSLEQSAQAASLKRVLEQLKAQMRQVPSGKFVMGTDYCKRGDAGNRNRCGSSTSTSTRYLSGRFYWYADPAHEVNVSAFSLQHTPVTCKQYDAFAFATGKKRLVNCKEYAHVNYEMATAFVTWISRVTGGSFRLPSEAEWEYAAFAGRPSVHPWGDCDGECKARPTNRFGVKIGEYLELVSDCWHENFAGAPNDGTSWDEHECPSTLRVMRGWHSWTGGYFYRQATGSQQISSGDDLINVDQAHTNYFYWGKFRLAQDK